MGYLIYAYWQGKPLWFIITISALWLVAWLWVYKTIAKKLWFLFSLTLFLIAIWLSINYSPIQNWLLQKATNTLSQELKTTVQIKHIDFSLFNKILLQGILVKDLKNDTLLYAGETNVSITDWFFMKDKPVVQYVGLKDAVLNINRSDSLWNYQFLMDKVGSNKKSTTGNKSNFEIDLKTIDLNNLKICQVDKWIGQTMQINLGSLKLNADKIDIKKKDIIISSLVLNSPEFKMQNYVGNRVKFPKIFNAKDTTNKDTYQWNTANWQINIKNILLKNGSFHFENMNETESKINIFDPSNIIFSSINGTVNNVKFTQDTLLANISLVTKERSGFEVKNLKSNFKFSPSIMEFKNLLLQTNKSTIKDYYAMNYNNFNDDFKDFIHNVKLDGNLINSTIYTDDIAFFAPQLNNWKRNFDLEGTVKGTIDNLSAKKIKLKSNNTFLDGDISLSGLPNLNSTFINFKSNNLQTTFSELINFVPVLKQIKSPPNLAKLGNVNFKGNFTGFINDFVTYGNIKTNLGNITADLNMKLPANHIATYSGNISSAGFRLGNFINSNQIGSISLDGKLAGSGFSFNNLKANFNGKIHQIDIYHYNYKNIALNGVFDKKLFKGNFSIDDENLKVNDLKGSINFNELQPSYNFSALLVKSDFKKLQFTNEEFSLNGLFNLNFTGNNIDNFLGTALIKNATLLHNQTKLSFDSLKLKSFIVDNKKELQFDTNELDGNISGNFKLLQLPDAFSLFLNKYYPAYIKKPTHNLANQDFTFLMNTKHIDDYVHMINKKLSGLNNSTFTGNLNLQKNMLNINATIPSFGFSDKTFTNTTLQSNGNIDSLMANIAIDNIAIGDSFNLPNTQLNVSSQNDLSKISLKTTANNTFSDAKLNATIQTFADGASINFEPSSIILGTKKWNLSKDGKISIHKNYIDANNILFSNDEQEILVSTQKDSLDKFEVIANLKKVNINEFIPYFLKNPSLQGLVTGKVVIKDPLEKPMINIIGEADNFVMDNNHIGKVNLNSEVNSKTGIINFHAKADEKQYKFAIDGKYNYLDDSTNNQIDVAFLADKFDISLLNPYLNSVFSNIQGMASSNLRLKGSKRNQYIIGQVTVPQAWLKVNYTQCKYQINDAVITFNPDEIDLGNIALNDTLGNKGVASGKLYHRMFQDFNFDNVQFKTDKMLVLNTTKKDNSSFYGKIIGKATLNLDGPITNMQMNITGEPSLKDSSHIFLLTGSSLEAGAIDYIDFVEIGHKMEENIKVKQETNILVNIDLIANPSCKVDVILDEATKDIIKGQGNGALNIKVGTTEPLSINGQYDITNGEYTFNFQTYFNKYFSIQPGSSIVWTGDPVQAAIDINANYLAKKVDLNTLNSSIQQKEDLTIIANLKGVLNKPDINFSIKLQEENSNNDYIVLKKLEDLKTDKSEMNKQIFSLLLLNTFIPTDKSVLNAGTTSSLAANYIGGMISVWFTNLLNKELEKITNGKISFSMDLNSGLSPENKASILQASLALALKLHLSNRLQLVFGGLYDYDNNYYKAFGQSSIIRPDINLEFLLNKDGTLRLVGYNKGSIDLTTGQRNRTGLKLSYKKDFDIPSREEKRDKKLNKAILN